MTNDAQPVVHSVDISGLAARARAGAEAYVCNYGYDSAPGATITPVNLQGGVADTAITTGTLPSALAATPDGREVLVTDQGQDLLTVLDARNGDVVARISTGVEPDAVAVSPDGGTALVANSDSASVTPVDLADFKAGPSIAVGPQPDAVAIGGPGGDVALVANLGGDSVTPVDLKTMEAGPAIKVGNEPDAIALAPDGEVAAVANLGSNSVSFVNLTTLTTGPQLNVGLAPTGIATESTFGSAGAVAWVSGNESLVGVSYPTERLLGRTADVGRLVESVAIAPAGRTAWVADDGPYVTNVDLSDGRVLSSVHVGGRPSAIVIPAPYK
jgi:YVTN family beta-propeller protein